MIRKLLKILLWLLLVFLMVTGLFAAWTWYQVNIGHSLAAGQAQTGEALGGLVIPQTAVFYAFLAGFFLLITIVSIWITYRLVMLPAADDA
ncbi:MAG: hypothetical protein M5U34_18775 [Chloroflexi bacterium]|nr:hypothetical protein [Chloroflexota bacterium]